MNIDPSKAIEMLIDLRGGDYKDVSGRILTASELTAHNTYEKPGTVNPKAFNEAKIKENIVKVTVPPASIIVLAVK